MAAHDQSHELGFDANDPHGVHADDEHGHVIVSNKLLLGVLTILLALTLLTVASAQAEVWLMDVFNVTLPWWVNVAVALSIAVVKGVLVLAIFMQLWFDNRLNLVAFATCLICVALFMGFSVGDRAARGALHTANIPEFTQGGTGYGLNYDELQGVFTDASGEKVNTAGLSITQVAKLKAIHEKYGGDVQAFEAAKAAKHHHDAHVPDAAHTFARTGLTPGLFSAEAPSHDEHGHDDQAHDDAHGEDDHGNGDHAEDDHSGEDADH